MKKILTVICLCLFLIMAPTKSNGSTPMDLTRHKTGQTTSIQAAQNFASTPIERNVFKDTLNEYMNDGGCWFCSTFASLFRAINKLATDMFIKLTNLFLMLLGFGLLFTIAFKVGRMVIQLQEVNLMQFLQDLFKPLGRGIIAVAFLTTFSIVGVVSDDNIFSILISPFLELAFYLSSTILKAIIGG